MLNMGFLEVGLVLLIALLILGPKRLPKAAHWLGQLFKKGRSLLHRAQQDLSDLKPDQHQEKDSHE